MIKKISIFLGILFFLLFGSSIILGSDELTLEESIKIALDQSLSIYSAKEEIKAKEFEELSAKADFLPKLSSSYTYTRLDNGTVNDAKYTTYPYNPLTGSHFPRSVSPLDTNTYQFNITVTQPLFTGWRLTILREIASLGVDTAKIQKEAAIQDLVLNVKEAYFGILKAEKLENVAKQAVEQLKANLVVSQAFYDEGIIAKNDLLQTEVQMAQARQNLIKAKNGVEITKSLFNKLLRRGLNQRVKIKDILDYYPISLLLDQCIEKAGQNRPEIKEVSLNVMSAEKAIDLAKSSYYPSVTLVGNYQREADDILLGSGPGEDPDNWTITLKGEWTFWEWRKKRHDVAAARAKLAKANYILNEIKDNIQLEVKEAYLSLREAEKNIQVAKKAVVQAEENFRMNEERYKQQVATSTDVLDALTLLTQARTNYFNALSEHNIAWARLERAMGIGYDAKTK
ncbi:MAG: TolC family protein [Deltaproteobacteria bacterium]|nr:TolC family protein [Deltaproteobacteria bacterium]